MGWTKGLTRKFKLELTPRAHEIVDLLAARPGHRYTPDEIVDELALESNAVLRGLLGELTKAAKRAGVSQDKAHSWFVQWTDQPEWRYWLDQERADWWTGHRRSFWAFKANPDRYDIEKALSTRNPDWWATKGSSVGAGDRVIVWKTLGRTNERGLLYLGEVEEGPIERPDTENTLWLNEADRHAVESRVLLRYYHPPSGPLWVGGSADDLLLNLSAARAHSGSVFKVTAAEWDSLLIAVGGWPGSGEPEGWGPDEIRQVVWSYFRLLVAELNGNQLSKTEARRELLPLLEGRSEAAIEFKHQNISAVLNEEGLPYVQGYKPRGNYQRALAAQVLRVLAGDRDLASALGNAADRAPEGATNANESVDVFVDPPGPTSRNGPGRRRTGAIAIRVDYSLREERNRALGRAGEDWVIRLEKRRLEEGGRSDLAERVEHVSVTKGDGLGYDVSSFELDGSERFIEVKTTRSGVSAAFFITANELETSQDLGDAYHLYRVFDFSGRRRVYVLRGRLDNVCTLKPSGYTALPSA